MMAGINGTSIESLDGPIVCTGGTDPRIHFRRTYSISSTRGAAGRPSWGGASGRGAQCRAGAVAMTEKPVRGEHGKLRVFISYSRMQPVRLPRTHAGRPVQP